MSSLFVVVVVVLYLHRTSHSKMKRLLLIGLFVGLVFADSPVDKFVQEENVLVLKSDNFEDALKLDFVLVEFCK